MNTVTVNALKAEATVSDINTFSPLSLQINYYTKPSGTKTNLAPGDITDVMLVLHYELE